MLERVEANVHLGVSFAGDTRNYPTHTNNGLRVVNLNQMRRLGLIAWVS
jgi:hypothetical protein